MPKNILTIIGIAILFLGTCIAPLTQGINSNVSNSEPTIEIINPKEGYLHISGIQLLRTPCVFNANTISIGGFRFKPIQVKSNDEQNDNITVILRINGEDKGLGTWNDETGYAEWYWTGLTIGPQRLEFRVEDMFGHYSSWIEIIIWNFCIFP